LIGLILGCLEPNLWQSILICSKRRGARIQDSIGGFTTLLTESGRVGMEGIHPSHGEAEEADIVHVVQ